MMKELEHTMTNDLLFKMVFLKNQNLLKHFISVVLGIDVKDIKDFIIINTELLPENLGDKFCKFDIHMTVNGKKICLEVQVRDEGDYRERTMFYLAKDFAAALAEGGNYNEIPQVIIISIVDFILFEKEDFKSTYLLMDEDTHEVLSDKMKLKYYELKKLKDEINANEELKLWLKLFKAKTVEELKKLENTEVPFMREAVATFREVSKSKEFKEIERMRSKARHDEAQALFHAELKGMEKGRAEGIAEGIAEERARMEKLLAEKDAEIAQLKKKTTV